MIGRDCGRQATLSWREQPYNTLTYICAPLLRAWTFQILLTESYMGFSSAYFPLIGYSISIVTNKPDEEYRARAIGKKVCTTFEER